MNFLKNLMDKKNILLKKINIFFFSIIIIIFFSDRYSKFKVLNNFNQSVYYLNDYINIDLIWNTGIGFGLFSTGSSFYYNFVTCLVGAVIILLLIIFISSDNLDKFIYSLIIGGAFGNFYDRIVYNAVPDFIDLHYNNFHWFTFNIADIFISLGIIIFILRSFFVKN